MNALFNCFRMSETCVAVTVYANGEDRLGCSAGNATVSHRHKHRVGSGRCSCQAIVAPPGNCGPTPVERAGTNGCSDKRLAILKTEVPTSSNTFVSSDCYTIVLTEAQKALVSVTLTVAGRQLRPQPALMRAG